MRPAPLLVLAGIGPALLASGCIDSLAGLGDDDSEAAPLVRLQVDEALDRLVVEAMSRDANWNRLELQVLGCRTSVEGLVPRMGASPLPVNERADAGGQHVAEPSDASVCGKPIVQDLSGIQHGIGVGDFVQFCFSPAGSGASMTDVRVRMHDWPALGAVVLDATFHDIATCSA